MLNLPDRQTAKSRSIVRFTGQAAPGPAARRLDPPDGMRCGHIKDFGPATTRRRRPRRNSRVRPGLRPGRGWRRRKGQAGRVTAAAPPARCEGKLRSIVRRSPARLRLAGGRSTNEDPRPVGPRHRNAARVRHARAEGPRRWGDWHRESARRDKRPQQRRTQGWARRWAARRPVGSAALGNRSPEGLLGGSEAPPAGPGQKVETSPALPRSVPPKRRRRRRPRTLRSPRAADPR
jgi:hypothetical protein